MNIEALIHPMTFAAINSDAFVEHGVNKGDIVFVAGTRAVPISDDDLYTQRVKMFVHKINEDETIDFKGGLFLMDPNSLVNIDKGENDRLFELNYPAENDGEAA